VSVRSAPLTPAPPALLISDPVFQRPRVPATPCSSNARSIHPPVTVLPVRRRRIHPPSTVNAPPQHVSRVAERRTDVRAQAAISSATGGFESHAPPRTTGSGWDRRRVVLRRHGRTPHGDIPSLFLLWSLRRSFHVPQHAPSLFVGLCAPPSRSRAAGDGRPHPCRLPSGSRTYPKGGTAPWPPSTCAARGAPVPARCRARTGRPGLRTKQRPATGGTRAASCSSWPSPAWSPRTPSTRWPATVKRGALTARARHAGGRGERVRRGAGTARLLGRPQSRRATRCVRFVWKTD
jgi:hypothetical protein